MARETEGDGGGAEVVFVAVCLEGWKDPEIEVEKLYFKGAGGTDKKEHEVTLEFSKWRWSFSRRTTSNWSRSTRGRR